MKVRYKEAIIINDEHAIFLTDDDVKEFNYAASCRSDGKYEEMTKSDIIAIIAYNLNIYYRGKMLGFNDTEVREEICEILEKSTL